MAAAAAAAAADAAPSFCVLGGGLAGLASAFFLQRSFPLARICIVGGRNGLVATSRGSRGQLLEQGFHSSILNNKSGREALGLAKLLRLDEDVIGANIEASSRRHLLLDGRVQYVPRLQHCLRFGPALLGEPLWPRGKGEDESVHSFVARRTSAAVAKHVADPMCRGQFGGDAHELSVRTCFPRLWYNERRFRSIFMGSFFSVASAYKQRSWLSLDLFDPLLQRISAGGRLYSFRNGMASLLDKLEQALEMPSVGSRPARLLTSNKAVQLRRKGSAVEVVLDNGEVLPADAVIAAVPPHELAQLLEASGLDAPTDDASLCQLLASIEHRSVTVVGMSYPSDVLKGKFRGAGYFVGSLEKQEQPEHTVLAASWDSQLFPEQTPGSAATRLTVYVAGKKEQAEEAALQAVRKHLKVEEEPEEVLATGRSKALPQYSVGHNQRLSKMESARCQHLPWLQVVGGGYFGTRSAADDIVDARKLVDSLGRRFARFPGLVENELREDTLARYGGGFDVP